MSKICLTLVALLFSFASFAIGLISGTGSICIGASATLSDTALGGVWSSGNPSVATVNPTTGVVTGVSAGSVVITYTLGIAYTVATETVLTYVAPAPITGSSVFCTYDSSDTLHDATTGGIFSGGSVLTTLTPGGVLQHGVCTIGCGSVFITYTLPTGCFATYQVTVSPIASTYGPDSICTSATASTIAYPPGGTWTSLDTTIATITSGGTVTGVSRGNASFAYHLLGCALNLTGIKVSPGILTHEVINDPSVYCSGLDYYMTACGYSTNYHVNSWYGDGTSDNTLFAPGVESVHILHGYTFPGTYHIKQVLFDSTVRKDSVAYSYEYFYCRTLPIKIFNDNNHNAIFDSGDNYSFLPSVVEVDSNGIMVDKIGCTSGLYYQAFGPAGTVYTFKLITPPSGMGITIPASGVIYDTIRSTVNTYTPKYFGIDCNGSVHFDLGVYPSMLFGRHQAFCNILVNNTYCTPETPVLTMNTSPKYSFAGSWPAPTSVVGNVLTWDLESVFSESQSPQNVQMLFRVPGAWLLPGDTIQTSFLVNPVSGDVNMNNNSAVRIDTVKSSYDPNEMSVAPAGCIAAGTELFYTINFENTGNDTAHDIYVMDTLSDHIIPQSLRIVASSGVMNIARFQIGGKTIVKFDFPAINLLDSSHHNQCDGFLTFGINTVTGLPIGTTILNHAGIFFDDNPVVMTDTVTNIVCDTVLKVNNISNKHSVQLLPNPATDELTITMDMNAYSSFIITNEVGQLLLQGPMYNAISKVNIKELPSGMYLILLKGESGNKVMKFVKM